MYGVCLKAAWKPLSQAKPHASDVSQEINMKKFISQFKGNFTPLLKTPVCLRKCHPWLTAVKISQSSELWIVQSPEGTRKQCNSVTNSVLSSRVSREQIWRRKTWFEYSGTRLKLLWVGEWKLTLNILLWNIHFCSRMLFQQIIFLFFLGRIQNRILAVCKQHKLLIILRDKFYFPFADLNQWSFWLRNLSL